MNADMRNLLDAMSDGLSAADLIFASAAAEIAVAISTKRLDMELSQTELAKLMGKTQATISKWENADCNFTLQTLAEIAQALDMNLEIKLTPNKLQEKPKISNVIPFTGRYSFGSSSGSTWRQAGSEDAELLEM